MGLQSIYNANYFSNANRYQNYGFGGLQSSFNFNSFNPFNVNSLFGSFFSANSFNFGYSSNFFAPRRPVKVDKTVIKVEPKKPEDVILIGAYKNNYINNFRGSVNVDLGNTIKDFSSMEGGNPNSDAAGGNWSSTAHDRDSSNNLILKNLYSKMSEEDKKRNFNNGEVYAISKRTGKIIGTLANNQIVDGALTGGYVANASVKNDKFSVLSDLGINKTDHWGSATNMEEGNGGQIELNGRKYNVATTVLRKETPLTFDLNGDGVKTSDKLTQFDINGDGKKETINDVADGTLSIRGGKDARDLFGNNTDLDGDGKADGFANGFDALKALATKEGLINGKDDMKLDAKDLQILKAKYQLGMKTAGYNSEAKDLEEAGITEINLGNTDKVKEKVNFDGRNNDVLTQDGATFKINGKNREYADVLHAIKA